MNQMIKIGRKPNIITIPREEKYNEMFTTDLNRIRDFIAVSDYPDIVDPNIILDINKHGVKLSRQDFKYYLASLPPDYREMMHIFQSTIDVDNKKRIGKTIKRHIENGGKRITVEDLLYLMSWEGKNHDLYLTFKELESGELILH
jgi:hypothetical protein